ncbi:MAG TPA: hypothetical protein ENI87_05840 [bacterium]|nr:hypothetical protein [bacterium]
MRPVFLRPLPGTGTDFFRSLDLALTRPGAPCRGMLYGEGDSSGAILRRHEQDQLFWSPALHLHVERDGEGGAYVLRGRFSPSSPVWTAFLAIYLTLAIVAIASGCYGGAQIIVDETPWAFLGVPVALLLAGFTYGAAFIGQGLGGDDMYELRSFVERIADKPPRD